MGCKDFKAIHVTDIWRVQEKEWANPKFANSEIKRPINNHMYTLRSIAQANMAQENK